MARFSLGGRRAVSFCFDVQLAFTNKYSDVIISERVYLSIDFIPIFQSSLTLPACLVLGGRRAIFAYTAFVTVDYTMSAYRS
jgi:hypothetical protein